ncbi:hypothetical protein GGR55DRAFT_349117 [Xylaria sp. FL0064]|nr:hypothetical protein GGR55DRAFT_349117 [Xylaria sp. FL0064]
MYREFPESKTSIGVAVVRGDRRMFSPLITNLVKYRELIGHPHILPFAAQRTIDFELVKWLDWQKDVIVEAQAETGYHEMLLLARSGRVVDYSRLSAKMTGTVINIADAELCWTILLEHGDMLIDRIVDLEAPAGGDEKSTAAAASFQYEVRLARRRTQMFLLEAKSWERRGTILLQGIFNLIAQQDQNTSIGIAEDSRILAAESNRDRTSMKTLAVVTMAFLPGAFVAAVLAIPVFQWDAINPSEIVSRRF